jgi:hypothetical protein
MKLHHQFIYALTGSDNKSIHISLINFTSMTSQQSNNPLPTSIETACPSAKSQQQKKDRFTRAERRAFKKQKDAAQHTKKPKQANKTHTKAPANAKNFNVDDAINLLIALRGTEVNRKFQNFGPTNKPLQDRVTRGAPKKAEPSSKKLEKIQKRKGIRAERRKAYLAKRVVQEGADTQIFGAGTAIPQEGEEVLLMDDQEINFDDL